MGFEDEVYHCIQQQSDIVCSLKLPPHFPALQGKTLYIEDKNIVFHLVPVDSLYRNTLPPVYFQKKTFEYRSKGLQLVHLWQDMWIRKQETVQSRIRALLGNSRHIYARQTSVRRLEKNEMRAFFAENHLQDAVSAVYVYGLIYENRLVASASFSRARAVVRDGMPGRSCELLRYANLNNHRVVGGMGKLLSHFISEHRPDDIMTYADLDWATGKSYHALHFQQTATTLPQMFWIHPDEMIRYYPHRLPQKLTDDFQRQELLSLDEFLTRQGYRKIFNAGNIKYIKLIG